jgi:hypothetical protein
VYIGDLEDLIKRNETYPNIRFIASHWGRRQGAPEDTVTVLVGDWPMTYKHGKPYVSPEHIGAYNVPTPFVPRDSIVAEDGSILKRGYRSLLMSLLNDRAIRPTEEIMGVINSQENL